MNRRRIVATLSVALLAPTLAVVSQASAASAAPAASVSVSAEPQVSDVKELNRKDLTLDGQPIDVPSSYQTSSQRIAAAAVVETPAVGTVRQWLGLDDQQGILYRKDYTLRAVGAHIEVWVANDISFPAGDCRAQIPSSTVVTDDQAQYLADQFDNNMYPKEIAAFSTPPDRDGSKALVGPDPDGNGGVYTGGGEKTVTLVDNVRDDNYYSFPKFPTYIAGFFSSQINELLDRNVMTIDAFDWLHRAAANPPNDPTADLCTSRPGRPNLYEGTFAHEWQHLLQYYTDPGESTWLNEGLSDFAQTLVGYVDSTKTVFDKGGDSHIYCFEGFGKVRTDFNTNPRDCGGPENSLNLWGENPNPDAILADYGNAYSAMLFYYDRFGLPFISRLHRDGDLQGIASLAAALKAEGQYDPYRSLHDFQSSTFLDGILGVTNKSVMIGVNRWRVTTASLKSTINLDNPAINMTPGAAPNGADYVPLKGAAGTMLSGADITNLSFDGAAVLPSLPLAWTIVRDDPDRNGNPVLFSGNDSNTDAAAVIPVTVPAADPTLTFIAKYGAELTFDYGYVEVSTDGGNTYTAIPGDKTVDGPRGPGVNGTTTGFEPHSYDLSAYAGQSILLGFRYVSDSGVNEGGWLIDDIKVGGDLVSDGSSVDGFKSVTEIVPVKVWNWNVRIIGYDVAGAKALQLTYNKATSFTLTPGGNLDLIKSYPKVLVIVSYDEPTELVQQYAPYTLAVNGVVQAGGEAVVPSS